MKFKANSEGFRKFRNQSILYSAVVALVITALFLSTDSGWSPSLIFITILIVTTFQRIRRESEVYKNLVITIDADQIIVEGLTTTKVIVNKADITKISTNRANHVCISTKENAFAIEISYSIENYDEMISELSKTMPISSDTPSLSWTIIMTAIAIGLFVGNFLIKDRTVTLVFYGITIILLTAGFIFAATSGYVDRRTKRNSWILLIPWCVFMYLIVNLLMR